VNGRVVGTVAAVQIVVEEASPGLVGPGFARVAATEQPDPENTDAQDVSPNE
jgi:hypothetical protein